MSLGASGQPLLRKATLERSNQFSDLGRTAREQRESQEFIAFSRIQG